MSATNCVPHTDEDINKNKDEERELCDQFVLYGRCSLMYYNEQSTSCPLLHATLPPIDGFVLRSDRKHYQRLRWLFQVLPLDQVQMHLTHLVHHHREQYCILCNIDHLFLDEVNGSDYIIDGYIDQRRCVRRLFYGVCDHINCFCCLRQERGETPITADTGIFLEVALPSISSVDDGLQTFLNRYYEEMITMYEVIYNIKNFNVCASDTESTTNKMIAPSLCHHEPGELTRLEDRTNFDYNILADTRFCWFCRKLPTTTLWKLWNRQKEITASYEDEWRMDEQADEILDLIFNFIGRCRDAYRTLSSLFFLCKRFYRILKDPRYWHRSPVRKLVQALFFRPQWKQYKLVARYLGISYSQLTTVGECISVAKQQQPLYDELLEQIAGCNRDAFAIGTTVLVRKTYHCSESSDDENDYSSDESKSSDDERGSNYIVVEDSIIITSARINITEGSINIIYSLSDETTITHRRLCEMMLGQTHIID